MITYSTFCQKEISDLFEKHGVFFAFSNEQLQEQINPKTKYYSCGAGMFVPQENFDAFNKEYDEMDARLREEYMKKYSRKDIIWYELSNHECQITNDYSDAVAAVKGFGITEEEVAKEFRPWFKVQVEEDNF